MSDSQIDFHPGLGLRFEITRAVADPASDPLEATNWIDPGMAGPPVHTHPAAEESYEVLEGSLEVYMDGKWSPVGAGEKATVPAGVPHSVRNLSDEPAKITNVHDPALNIEAFFREMQWLIAEGKIKGLPPKDPRSAIYAAMLFTKYPDEIVVVKPPNAVFKALTVVGRALRFQLRK